MYLQYLCNGTKSTEEAEIKALEKEINELDSTVEVMENAVLGIEESSEKLDELLNEL